VILATLRTADIRVIWGYKCGVPASFCRILRHKSVDGVDKKVDFLVLSLLLSWNLVCVFGGKNRFTVSLHYFQFGNVRYSWWELNSLCLNYHISFVSIAVISILFECYKIRSTKLEDVDVAYRPRHMLPYFNSVRNATTASVNANWQSSL